jgi:DNA-directed RNA polymerase specialized sigma24 family protein
VTDDELDRAFLVLAETGEDDRILRGLRTRYSRLPRAVVVEAYKDATVEVVRRHKRGQTITNLAGLLTTIARRKLAVVWRAAQEEEEAQQLLRLQVQHPEAWEHDEDRQAKVERAARFVRNLLPRLDNGNYRRTLATMLDAAQAGMQLENKELGDILGCSPNTAGMWKLRSFQRLRPLLEETGIVTLEDLLEMYPLPEDDEDDEYEETDDD